MTRRTFHRLLLTALLGGSSAMASQRPADPGKTGGTSPVEGNNAFAFDLYARLRDQPGNLFFSPYSISTALAMTYAGARGETAAEMARVLHFPADQNALHPAYRELIMELNGHGLPRDYQLVVANALWGRRGQFLPEFLQTTRANYGAGLRDVNFRFDPEQARRTINRWVESQTRDKIKELLQKDDVNKDTELVLTNAIYFKAAWEHVFQSAATKKDADFHVSSDKTTKVDLMQQTQTFPYVDAGTFQALALPYEGGDLQMLVLLPKAADGLAELEKGLTAAALRGCVAKLRPTRVEVALPKFKVNARLDVAGTLGAMGMPSAFRPDADFTGMDGRRGLYISKVIHQAFVDVDEEGTEAAAATAVVMMRASPPPKPAARFRADHPFVFLIRDTKTDSTLFLGRVRNPKA
jgi:serpin B